MQWPPSSSDTPAYHDQVGAIFNWVSDSGGVIVMRPAPTAATITTDAEVAQDLRYQPTLVLDDDEIVIWPGDWIVRMPGYADPETAAPTPDSRFIVETARDFAEDYQTQARMLRGGLDVMAQIKKVGEQAAREEDSMTPAQRREAATVNLHRLGDVAGKKR